MKIKQRRTQFKADRGATDPILVIAAIAVSLILLVGGSFAVQGIITNGKDLNAKGDLDKVTVAEIAYYAQSDSYIAYKMGGTASETALEKADVGFRPSEDPGSDLVVELEGTAAADNLGWNAASKSASGKIFIRTSQSNAVVTVGSETQAELAKLGLTPAEFTALAAKVS